MEIQSEDVFESDYCPSLLASSPSDNRNNVHEIVRRRHISCLPVEILTSIFAYLLPESLAIDDFSTTFNFFLPNYQRKRGMYDDLINISRVCHDWRQISLSNPSFWNLVWISHDEPSDRVGALLQRSGNAPLEIGINYPFAQLQGRLKKFLPEGPLRVEALRIRPNTHVTELQDLATLSWFEKPAPILETFDAFNLNLPNTFFDGQTGSLRKVSLRTVKFSWRNVMFKNLTFLHVFQYRDFVEPEDKVELRRVLEIVRDCPGLVSLELENVGPTLRTGDGPSENGPEITAQCLRKISLQGVTELDTLATHSFLTTLRTPLLRFLNVETDTGVNVVDDILPRNLVVDSRHVFCNCVALESTLVGLEVLRLTASQVGELDELVREGAESGRMGLRVLFEKVSKFDFYVGCSRWLVGLEENDGSNAMTLPLLRRSLVRSENIRALSIVASDFVLKALSFEDIFEIWPNVCHIEIWNGGVRMSAVRLTSFLKSAAQTADELNGAVALPSLKTLIFECVEFGPGNFKQLCDFLAHRKEREAPLLYLALNKCSGIGTRRRSTLKGMVSSLSISGKMPCWNVLRRRREI